MLFTDETVLIGTDIGEGHVYAFDRENGAPRWLFPAGRGVSTDIVSDRDHDRVYAVTLDDEAICLDLATGALRWRFATGADPPERFTMGSTPAVSAGVVAFGGLDGTVYALDRDSGEIVWKTPLGAEVVTSTLFRDGDLFVGTADARLHCLDARTGEVKISVDTGERPRGHLVPGPRGFFVLLGESGWEGEMACYDASLERRWIVSAPDGSTLSTARPFLRGPWILAGTSSGLLVAFDPGDGSVLWSHAVDPDRDWSEGDGVRVIGAHERTLFVGTISGMLYAFTEEEFPGGGD